MTQPTIAQLHNLTDRAAHGLTPDEQQRLRDGIDRLEHAEAALDQPGPATAQATAPAGLRARIAHTLRTTPNRHATNRLGFPDHHGPSEGYLGWCALCTRDVEALTEAVHTAMVAESPWLKATAEDLAAAEQRAARIADTLREVFATFTRVTVFGKTAFYQAEHPVAPDDMNRWRAVLDGEQPGPG